MENLNLPHKQQELFLLLPELYGEGDTVLKKAKRHLPSSPAIQNALQEVSDVLDFFKDFPIYVDLAELPIDHYHTGLLYSVYLDSWSKPLVRGGRYTGFKAEGEGRSASGFSFDLKDFLGDASNNHTREAIAVSIEDYRPAKSFIQKLRESGKIVAIDYQEAGKDSELRFGQKIVCKNGSWALMALEKD